MGELRTFFAKKEVVEVHVPVLSKNTVTLFAPSTAQALVCFISAPSGVFQCKYSEMQRPLSQYVIHNAQH